MRRPDQRAPRDKRRQATVYRQRRVRFVMGLVAVVVLVVVIVVVAVAAGRNRSQVSSEQLLAGGARPPTAPVSATSEERPAFARFGEGELLLLPVAAADATIIAYQPVSDDRAVPLTPIGQQVNANAFSRFFRGLFSGEASVRYYVLAGEEGEPTTSVLIGAAPDSPVTSPVSGVVSGVRQYLLFGKYEDVQIDIRPEGIGGITVTLLFIDNPAITIGQRVDEGETLLGTVRRCPEEVGKVLADYTHDSGSHVYLQVSEEPIN